MTKENVEAFLNQFHQKLKVFSIIFRDDRGKNAQTLADLEDYSQGPIVDTLNSLGEMWEYKIKYPLKGEKQ